MGKIDDIAAAALANTKAFNESNAKAIADPNDPAVASAGDGNVVADLLAYKATVPSDQFVREVIESDWALAHPASPIVLEAMILAIRAKRA